MEFIIPNHDNIHAAYTPLVAELLSALQGTLVVLTGPLGAGKTTLVQGVAKALESDAQVSSPTYTLIHEYPTPQGTLVHIDAYRLPSTDALLDLGLEDYLERSRLVVVEWGEGLLETFPDAWQVTLSFAGDERKAILVKGER
ncbi:MAG: tRNA (adenosine(37)-N6)-threonylcarbamoyltransferase complex ATPase subunit type 1 TsaE [Trueperaceae bacterium]